MTITFLVSQNMLRRGYKTAGTPEARDQKWN